MAYARIPLNFDVMNKAYRDNKTIPPQIQTWITKQNKYEKDENEKIRKENEERKAQGLEPTNKKELHISTTCCMQASLSFNATPHPIPSAGSTTNRDNTRLDDGKYYILAVDEFRAYLTHKYGPTDKIPEKDLSSITGKTGVMILGNWHIEFWDGAHIFQSLTGCATRKAAGIPINTGCVMAAGIERSGDRWFWQIGDSASKVFTPEWLKGWWTVYDGNYYYYYFHADGWVNYIDQKPNPKWIPPKNVGNQGTIEFRPDTFKITWREHGAPPATEETFWRIWGSQTEMNGTSNKYSPLFARKM